MWRQTTQSISKCSLYFTLNNKKNLFGVLHLDNNIQVFSKKCVGLQTSQPRAESPGCLTELNGTSQANSMSLPIPKQAVWKGQPTEKQANGLRHFFFFCLGWYFEQFHLHIYISWSHSYTYYLHKPSFLQLTLSSFHQQSGVSLTSMQASYQSLHHWRKCLPWCLFSLLFLLIQCS